MHKIKSYTRLQFQKILYYRLMVDLTQYEPDTKEQYLKIRHKFRVTAGVALAVLLIGAVFYHEVEGLNWLDAFYFCTITLTTVGYGDITPHTDIGKLFTIFYVLTGIGIIATFANLFLQNTFGRRQLKISNKLPHLPRKSDSEVTKP